MGTSDKVIYLEEFQNRQNGQNRQNRKEKIKIKNQSLSQNQSQNKTNTQSSIETESVIAIDELRERIIAEERRKVKRTFLTEFIGASVILPGSGLVRVTLNDVSLNGVSFDVVKKYGSFKEGDKVALRVYLNQSTYFPMEIIITNARVLDSDGVYRHGAKFTNESQNQEALGHFIKFMETVNTSLRADLGDILLTK